MADARANLDVRHVILPWAQNEASSDVYHAAARERVSADAYALRIADDRLNIGHDGLAPDGVDREARRRRRLLEPQLRAVGLPYEPHPSIPPEDRRTTPSSGYVSLAVALDIMCTLTRKLESKRTVLSELATVLLHVGKLAGIESTAVERLLEHAESVTGRNRALLTYRLAMNMQGATVQASESERGTTQVAQLRPSTPKTVATALRRIERAADRTIKEACLRLEAHESVEY
ncbi:MAG: hypothetical protein V3T05_12230, partial [Myxococcota bacterium]